MTHALFGGFRPKTKLSTEEMDLMGQYGDLPIPYYPFVSPYGRLWSYLRRGGYGHLASIIIINIPSGVLEK